MKPDAAAVGAVACSCGAPKDMGDWLGAAALDGGNAEAVAVPAGVAAAEGKPKRLVLPAADAPALSEAVVAVAVVAGEALSAAGAVPVPVPGAELMAVPNPLKLGAAPPAGAEEPPPKEKVGGAADAAGARLLGAAAVSDPPVG